MDERLVVGIFPPCRNTASGVEIPSALAEIAFLPEKAHNTSLGIRGILVFWYSGLALVKTRFLSGRLAFLR